VTANVPTAPSFSLRCPYTETTNKMDPRDEQRAVELRTAAAFPGRGSRAVMVPLLSLCCLGGGGQSMTWAQLSAMARQTKKALAYLHIVPAFLAMTASVVCADTLVLAAADTWPTAYLVDGRPTGMLVDLVTEAYRRAGHSVEVKLMPWARWPRCLFGIFGNKGCCRHFRCCHLRRRDGLSWEHSAHGCEPSAVSPTRRSIRIRRALSISLKLLATIRKPLPPKPCGPLFLSAPNRTAADGPTQLRLQRARSSDTWSRLDNAPPDAITPFRASPTGS